MITIKLDRELGQWVKAGTDAKDTVEQLPVLPTEPGGIDPTDETKDKDNYKQTYTEKGATASLENGVAWSVEWLDPKGFKFTGQGIKGVWGLTRYSPEGQELNPSFATPNGEKKELIDDRHDWQLVQVRTPNQNTSFSVARPKTPSHDGWKRTEYNYICREVQFQKGGYIAHLIWWSHTRLILRLSGDGTWHYKGDGLQNKESNQSVTGVSYVEIYDATRTLIITAPDGSKITEHIGLNPTPTALKMPKGYEIQTYGISGNTALTLTKEHAKTYLHCHFTDSQVLITYYVDGNAMAFQYKIYTTASTDVTEGNVVSGILTLAMAKAAMLEVYDGNTLLFSVPCPQLSTETIPLETWHSFTPPTFESKAAIELEALRNEITALKTANGELKLVHSKNFAASSNGLAINPTRKEIDLGFQLEEGDLLIANWQFNNAIGENQDTLVQVRSGSLRRTHTWLDCTENWLFDSPLTTKFELWGTKTNLKLRNIEVYRLNGVSQATQSITTTTKGTLKTVFVKADQGAEVTIGDLKFRMTTGGNRSFQVRSTNTTHHGKEWIAKSHWSGNLADDRVVTLTMSDAFQYLLPSYNFTAHGSIHYFYLSNEELGIIVKGECKVGYGYNNNWFYLELFGA